MGLINKGWYGMFVACGIWCLADVSSVSPSSEQTVCSDEGLTLETSAKHHIPQATNIPYQPLMIKPIISVVTHAEKQFFSKLVFETFVVAYRKWSNKRPASNKRPVSNRRPLWIEFWVKRPSLLNAPSLIDAPPPFYYINPRNCYFFHNW